MKEFSKEDFTKRLKTARENAIIEGKKATQAILAEKLELTTQAISNYETGKSLPDPETLSKIAYWLNKPVGWFFGDESAENVDVESLRPLNNVAEVILAALQISAAFQAPYTIVQNQSENRCELNFVIPFYLTKTFDDIRRINDLAAAGTLAPDLYYPLMNSFIEKQKSVMIEYPENTEEETSSET